jgi:hypothetical protein
VPDLSVVGGGFPSLRQICYSGKTWPQPARAPRLADIEFLDIFGGEELGTGDGAAYFVIGHRVCDK